MRGIDIRNYFPPLGSFKTIPHRIAETKRPTIFANNSPTTRKPVTCATNYIPGAIGKAGTRNQDEEQSEDDEESDDSSEDDKDEDGSEDGSEDEESEEDDKDEDGSEEDKDEDGSEEDTEGDEGEEAPLDTEDSQDEEDHQDQDEDEEDHLEHKEVAPRKLLKRPRVIPSDSGSDD